MHRTESIARKLAAATGSSPSSPPLKPAATSSDSNTNIVNNSVTTSLARDNKQEEDSAINHSDHNKYGKSNFATPARNKNIDETGDVGKLIGGHDTGTNITGTGTKFGDSLSPQKVSGHVPLAGSGFAIAEVIKAELAEKQRLIDRLMDESKAKDEVSKEVEEGCGFFYEFVLNYSYVITSLTKEVEG
jgi:hypothetical protein